VVAEALGLGNGPTRFSSLVAAPAMRVLSAIEGSALCGPAFLQVVGERRGRSYAFNRAAPNSGERPSEAPNEGSARRRFLAASLQSLYLYIS
jgi:hypothetical protein